MGYHINIGLDKFPKQSDDLNRQVIVAFNYDTSRCLLGKIIRDDVEELYKCIILLEDGRAILATECQYSFHEND